MKYCVVSLLVSWGLLFLEWCQCNWRHSKTAPTDQLYYCCIYLTEIFTRKRRPPPPRRFSLKSSSSLGLLDARRILEYDKIEQAKKGEQDRGSMTSCWISAGQSECRRENWKILQRYWICAGLFRRDSWH